MYFAVNGVPVFVRGANWIPATPFPNALSPDALRRHLASAVAAHMNMVRVWGGGIYQVDQFYDRLFDRPRNGGGGGGSTDEERETHLYHTEC